MRAIRYDRYGGPEVLGFVEIPAPTAGRGEVVVDVHALALNPKDVLVRKGKFDVLPGVAVPIVPGHDFAGVVSARGSGVELEVGTPVFGWVESFDGGASAEQVAIPAIHVARCPATMDMVQAASVPLAALTALQGLRDDLKLRGGEHVVINGGSGGVGVFAVQIARLLGARVTAVCSARNRELVLRLGAEAHLDYAVADPLDLRGVDAFFDVFGNKPWKQAKQTLGPKGRYCTTLPRPGTMLRGALARLGIGRATLVIVRSRQRDLEQLAEWIDAGDLVTVLHAVLPWEEIAAGHVQLETKHTTGKVVLTVVSP